MKCPSCKQYIFFIIYNPYPKAMRGMEYRVAYFLNFLNIFNENGFSKILTNVEGSHQKLYPGGCYWVRFPIEIVVHLVKK
jgi:hypothetical protein